RRGHAIGLAAEMGFLAAVGHPHSTFGRAAWSGVPVRPGPHGVTQYPRRRVAGARSPGRRSDRELDRGAGAAHAPGMRGYSQFCPVALASEVLAERWTPLIVRELLAGSHRFSELQRGLPRIPRALLVQRLGSLERAGLVERRPTRNGRGWAYHLSAAGEDLRPVVESL